ncbi:MAG: SDR family NAD(P)-dependent oxidoreductase [Terriglobales bacterium]
MQDKPVALVTGANQGIGLQIAKDLVAHGFTVLVGSRNLERGVAAAKEVGPDARALQLDVTDLASIAAAAVRVALLGPDGPTGTFTHAKLGTLPW